jgi:hypothetical protein
MPYHYQWKYSTYHSGNKIVKVFIPSKPIKKKENCYYCREMYRIGMNIHTHERVAHGKVRGVTPMVLLDSEKTVEKWILSKCGMCNEVFKRRNESQSCCSKHIFWYSKNYHEICAICGNISKGMNIKEHIRIVHTGVFVVKRRVNMDEEVLVWNGDEVSEDILRVLMIKNVRSLMTKNLIVWIVKIWTIVLWELNLEEILQGFRFDFSKEDIIEKKEDEQQDEDVHF